MSVEHQLTNIIHNMLKYPEYLTVYTDGIAEILRRHPAQAADLFGHICRTLMTYPTTPETSSIAGVYEPYSSAVWTDQQQKLFRYINIGGVQRLRHTTAVSNLLEDADYRSTLLESLRPLSIGLVVQQELLADLFPE